jgi:mannose-6-phosphate isomerase
MEPLVFEPYLRPVIWGGRLLERRLAKPLPAEGDFGESWELSAHPLHVSRVADGPWRGLALTELWQQRQKEIAGDEVKEGSRFPWLVKFLDCRDLLSVQVHPDDSTARELLGDESGKTEAWIVLHAEASGRIYAGLKPGTTRGDLQRHLDAGTVAQCLHSFAPRTGDCVFLPAGTVHAAGGGVLLAEVQQSSDATFRLFDWNRLGPDGRPRALHREAALGSIHWSAGPVQPILPQPLPGSSPGSTGERLVQCPCFRIDRYRVISDLPIPYGARMSVWMVIDAQAELRSHDSSYHRAFACGQSVLLPASAGPMTWLAGRSPATLLAVTMPFVKR